METYFVRHNIKVEDSVILKMIDENYFGIDYTIPNLDRKEYEKKGVGALSAFDAMTKIAKEGGYVFAIYKNNPCGVIGYVEPNTKLELENFDSKVKLKVIRFTKTKKLTEWQTLFLRAMQPQRTISRWPIVNDLVKNIFNNELPNPDYKNLSPTLLEVMCMEYLRTKESLDNKLPQLACTLLPVGRTLVDVDILGLSIDNKKIFAQVTHAEVKNDSDKMKKLEKYKTNDNYTILFHDCEKSVHAGNHYEFPIRDAFNDYCKKNPQGKVWFDNVIGAQLVGQADI